MYRVNIGGQFKDVTITPGQLIPDAEFEALPQGVQAVWLGNGAVELVDADPVAAPESDEQAKDDEPGEPGEAVKKPKKPKPVAPAAAAAEAIP